MTQVSPEKNNRNTASWPRILRLPQKAFGAIDGVQHPEGTQSSAWLDEQSEQSTCTTWSLYTIHLEPTSILDHKALNL